MKYSWEEGKAGKEEKERESAWEKILCGGGHRQVTENRCLAELNTVFGAMGVLCERGVNDNRRLHPVKSCALGVRGGGSGVECFSVSLGKDRDILDSYRGLVEGFGDRGQFIAWD